MAAWPGEKDLKGKEGPCGHALTLEREPVEPPSGHPSLPGIMCKGEKHPPLLPRACSDNHEVRHRGWRQSDTGAGDAQTLLSRSAHVLVCQQSRWRESLALVVVAS